MDWISTIAVLQKVVHSLSYPSKIFDQRNGSCPTSKKIFSTKNESKCTQTSQSVNLDGHCEFIFFLENDFYYGIQDCDLCFVLFFIYISLLIFKKQPKLLQASLKNYMAKIIFSCNLVWSNLRFYILFCLITIFNIKVFSTNCICWKWLFVYISL